MPSNTPADTSGREQAEIRRLEERLRHAPDDGRAWLGLATLLSRQAPGKKLFHAIEQAIRSLPESDDVWRLAAEVQTAIRGRAQAVRWLDQMARQNPGLVAPNAVLAGLLSDSEPVRAIEILSHLHHRRPEDKRVRTALERLHRRQGDADRLATRWQAALEHYRQADGLHPEDPALLNNIGCCLAALEHFEDAERSFKDALRLRPGFTEARLNIGLLRASRLETKAATETIAEVLEDPHVEPATRRSAETVLAILEEHRRLEPALRASLESGDIEGLQVALEQVPDELAQPHEASVSKAEALASLCTEFDFDAAEISWPVDIRLLSFAEACALCRIPADDERIHGLLAKMDRPLEAYRPNGLEDAFRHALEVIRERREVPANPTLASRGEAWLKYWHARLMSGSPGGLPGQYKAVENALIGHPLTPPENVSGTIRVLLRDIRPRVPSGLARGVFMYVAINAIHGFADGNGRLARFLLNWELEAAALPGLVISPKIRPAVALSINQAWFEGRLEPLVTNLSTAASETARLLEKWSSPP